MKKIYSIILLLAVTFSCDWKQENPGFERNILINSDSEQLSERISIDGTGVVSLLGPDFLNGRISEDEIPAGKFPMILVAQAEGPTHNGKVLKATHVDIDGDFAYVSYNKEGAEFIGAVEIYNISEPTKPKITAQAIFTTADINALKFHEGRLHIAAAFDVDAEREINTAAQYLSVSVGNGQFTSDFVKSDLEGFAGTGVTFTNSHAAVTSGNGGIVALFDGNHNKIASTPITDLRDVAFGNNILAALSGEDGVSLLNATNLNAIGKINLDKDTPDSKRTLDIDGDLLFTSEGAKGAGVYSLPSGSLVEKIAILSNPEGVENGDIVTNAVSFDEGLLMMANGGAGVEVVEISTNNETETLGLLSLFGSSNFVKLKGKHLFVASGSKGLQILEIERTTSVPAPGVNCENLTPYRGSSNLNVNSNDVMRFSGSASLSNINVGGTLTFCGSMAVQDNMNINSNGFFEMSGSFSFGRYQGNSRLNINNNAVLKISGSAVIYGDLTLNSGATLEFVGEGTSITVYGKVTKNNNVTIKGDFIDTEGKLK
ncbi:hypothetical protein Belba_0600 [Belliella baltica DSM 15883]|uniref:Uncharacterized protein n=1 Tax=Belliella baltica (strain DSM 15883 / CIP 108006 / LMG 21964 / BA134) TaxID=866536 RepID=I3Z1Y9_BELBD|nr:hypothetical protein [Belliella baltica]AFL83257.1 hypothetical protein Belba_0600 [Belliella baltica DSM 15883]